MTYEEAKAAPPSDGSERRDDRQWRNVLDLDTGEMVAEYDAHDHEWLEP